MLAPYLAAAATLATLVGVVDVVAAERVAAAATLATLVGVVDVVAAERVAILTVLAGCSVATSHGHFIIFRP